jgi:NAD(P)-dependent dehydrogenase (short-subunit alcohol dehydrogenase family)
MTPPEARVIVITGGTGGLGLATAQALLEASGPADPAPTTLILTARTVEKGRQAPGLAEVEKIAKDKAGWEVVVMALELDDEGGVQRFKEEVEARHGKIDVLVSNAGAWCAPCIPTATPLLAPQLAFGRRCFVLRFMSPQLFSTVISRRVAVISASVYGHPAVLNIYPWLWPSSVVRIDAQLTPAAHLDFSIDEKTLTTAQAFTRTLHTNITATHTLITTLLPLLFVPGLGPSTTSRRIIFVSSGISSLADHADTRISINQSPPAGFPKQPSFNVLTYRTSKTGLNMLALEWARILREDAFKVHILDPGLLATSLGGADPVKIKNMGAEEPIVGGRFVSDVVQGKWDEKVEVLLNRHGVVSW